MKYQEIKNLFKTTLLLSLITLVFSSCSKTDNATPPKSSLTEIIQSQPNFSILKSAIDITNLNSILDTGNVTFFAPTNTAFKAFFTNSNGLYIKIEDVPVPLLKQILLNHFLTGQFLKNNLISGYYKTLSYGNSSATNPMNLYVLNVGTVKLNGISTIVNGDVIARNGILHAVDQVLILPNITNQLVANPNFDSFKQALTSPTQPTGLLSFATILSANGSFTVFAPTNLAFTDFLLEKNYTSVSSIATPVLNYHIITTGQILSSTFFDNQTIGTLQGSNLKLKYLLGDYYTVDSSNRLSKISFTDIQCSNGLIHVLDKVMLPI